MKALLPILAILCLATAYPAWIASPKQISSDVPVVQDKYFGVEIDDGQDPSDFFSNIGAVEVSTWNDTDAALEQILVNYDAELGWVISNKYNYPADGDSKIGKTASQVIGIAKGREVAKDSSRHASLGVVDPLDESVLEPEGFGKRVTIKDRNDQVLVDVIIGEQVEGADQGWYYVREADSEKVYAANVMPASPDEKSSYRSLSVSSRFIDWVEDNPLDIDKADVRNLSVDKYSIDTTAGTLKDRQIVAVQRKNGTEDWKAPELPEGKEINTEEIDKILNKLSSLRLADIDKYKGLGQLELQARGFYPQQGNIFASEGSMRFALKNGMNYHLFFGEVVGTVTKAAESEDDETSTGDKNDRYMFIALSYDEQADATKPQPKPAKEAAEGEEAEAQEDPAEYAKRVAKHVAEQQKKVTELNQKYQAYFYIIRDYDFQSLRPDVTRLFKDVAKKEDDKAATGGAAPGPMQP